MAMMAQLRAWLAPAYLFACLVVGGSSLGVWGNAFLQLVAVGIIIYACVDDGDQARPSALKPLWWLVAAAILLILLQLVPLPPAIWHKLPGRDLIVNGDALLGLVGSRPVSLSPPETWEVLVTLLPPVAMIAAVVLLGSKSGRRMTIALVAATIAHLLLGLLQVGSGESATSWYLYPRSNVGVATGFFANGNHLAALLLCALPMIAATVEHSSAAIVDRQRRWTIAGAAIGLAAVVMAGLILNGSLFGLAMLAPVTVGSLLIAFRHSIGRNARLTLGLGTAVVLVGGILLGVSQLSDRHPGSGKVSFETRIALAEKSLAAATEYFPVGSGAGTFEQVYPLFEDPGSVDRFFVNHAHNDYLEWAVEGGLAGLVLLALFLWWWGAMLMAMLRDKRSTGYAQASAIIGLVLLIHSFVDFPLRTPALAVLFAAATGLMIVSRKLPRQRPDLRPARHVTIP